jgi:NADH-quinone oxidoreductase subunit L
VENLWLAPALPFASFLILALFGMRLPRWLVAALGAGSVGTAAVISISIAANFLSSPPPGSEYTQTLWSWVRVGDFQPNIGLYLDPLSLMMLLVVTVVGFFIHLYATQYMQDDARYSRFFAYMNLFVGSMLMLVLGDNLLLLYLGWEGVGLCSFLLIGFWFHEQANADAAKKAFVVTRVGDAFMAVGIFILFTQLGTIDIQDLLARARLNWQVGSGLAVAVAALLLGGAVGKSAQLPLQTWLPDAMAGPTPVSALIHAATMVTAGVYLIARMHIIYELAPSVMTWVAVIGAVTLLLAGFTALTQRDIKRVLAYSTISQIGYMFLALGVGAWSAAAFHLMTHAFFKALLFLAAGAVIFALHHEQDIFKMGGLRKQMPFVFLVFLIGGAALAGFPLVTAGFYSKDLILWETFTSPHGSKILWAAGLFGAFLTAIYTFRLIFLVFFGHGHAHVHHKPGVRMLLPLGVLAVLSIIGGFVEIPDTMGGGKHIFTNLLAPSFGEAAEHGEAAAEHGAEHAPFPTGTGVTEAAHTEHAADHGTELLLQIIAGATALLGIFIAARIFLRPPTGAMELGMPGLPAALQRFWAKGWGFDALYDALFVRPLMAFARFNKSDAFDLIYKFIAWMTQRGHFALKETQTGLLRWYAAGIAAGALVVLTLTVMR